MKIHIKLLNCEHSFSNLLTKLSICDIIKSVEIERKADKYERT